MDKPAKGQWWKWTTNTYRHEDWHDAFQLGDRYIDAGWKVEGRPDVWVGDSAFDDGVTMVRLPDQRRMRMVEPAKGQWWRWPHAHLHQEWHDAFQIGDKYENCGWTVDGHPGEWFCDDAFDGVRLIHLPNYAPPDIINDPPHYKSGGMEAVDVIEAFKLDWHLGSAAKYLLRAGRKGDALEDLRKCKWFLERKIAQLENK